jgi:hypothetical protein
LENAFTLNVLDAMGRVLALFGEVYQGTREVHLEN